MSNGRLALVLVTLNLQVVTILLAIEAAEAAEAAVVVIYFVHDT
jgi:hypothetical protein